MLRNLQSECARHANFQDGKTQTAKDSAPVNGGERGCSVEKVNQKKYMLLLRFHFVCPRREGGRADEVGCTRRHAAARTNVLCLFAMGRERRDWGMADEGGRQLMRNREFFWFTLQRSLSSIEFIQLQL